MVAVNPDRVIPRSQIDRVPIRPPSWATMSGALVAACSALLSRQSLQARALSALNGV